MNYKKKGEKGLGMGKREGSKESKRD